MHIRKLPRWLNRPLLVLIPAFWFYNDYKMATSFHEMSLLARFNAVLFLLLGPILFWRDFLKQV